MSYESAQYETLENAGYTLLILKLAFFLTLFPGMGYLNNNLDHSPIFMQKHAGLVLADMAQYLREGKILQTNSNNFPQRASQVHIPKRSSTNVL